MRASEIRVKQIRFNQGLGTENMISNFLIIIEEIGHSAYLGGLAHLRPYSFASVCSSWYDDLDW